MIMRPNQRDMRGSNAWHRVATTVIIQRVTTMKYVRFRVTICLYLSLNNKARSLSTLMAATVIKDIKDNPYPEMEAASQANRQSLHCSWTTYQTNLPTNRSVVARQQYKSFDGGWREDILWSATKIREFPRNAVMGKKNVDCWQK